LIELDGELKIQLARGYHKLFWGFKSKYMLEKSQVLKLIVNLWHLTDIEKAGRDDPAILSGYTSSNDG